MSDENNKIEKKEDSSSEKINYEYDSLNIPNFNDEDHKNYKNLRDQYLVFDKEKDIILYPYLFIPRTPKFKEPFAYDGNRCIVVDCKGNNTEEHYQHISHIMYPVANFLRSAYNLDRTPEPISSYFQGVFTVLTELLSPTADGWNKKEIDMKIIENTLEKLSIQAPQVSKFMVEVGMVRYRAKHDDSRIEHITSQEQLDEVLKTPLIMIDFWADWCSPCHALNPILKDLSHEMSDIIKIVKVNVDEQELISKRFNIESMPTMVLCANGNEVNRIVGVKDKDSIINEIMNARKSLSESD